MVINPVEFYYVVFLFTLKDTTRRYEKASAIGSVIKLHYSLVWHMIQDFSVLNYF